MRVLHVAATYLPATRYGGTIASVHGLCKALAARGHDVHVYTTSVDGPGDSEVEHGVPVEMDGVRVWYFRSTHVRRIFYAPALGDALRAKAGGFDVIHSHAIYLWPLWAAARAARRAGVPHVISPRGMLEKELILRKSALWKSLLIAFVEKRRFESAAAVHVTSRREREEAEQFAFNFPPFVEVPNGVDVAGPPAAAVTSQPPFILFLGRINWKKGLDRLIAAMAEAPSASLVIAGNDEEGYQRIVERLADAHGVRARVRFAGVVHGSEKAALLQHARVLVLPSYSENFGNVVLEAWAEGCPVIVTPEVGVADVVSDAGGGWVVNGNAAALGGAIEHAITDAADRARAGERGRAEVRRRFTWDSVARQMETVYENARARGTGRS